MWERDKEREEKKEDEVEEKKGGKKKEEEDEEVEEEKEKEEEVEEARPISSDAEGIFWVYVQWVSNAQGIISNDVEMKFG